MEYFQNKYIYVTLYLGVEGHTLKALKTKLKFRQYFKQNQTEYVFFLNQLSLKKCGNKIVCKSKSKKLI